jgi:hypothetical protein
MQRWQSGPMQQPAKLKPRRFKSYPLLQSILDLLRSKWESRPEGKRGARHEKHPSQHASHKFGLIVYRLVLHTVTVRGPVRFRLRPPSFIHP